MKRFIRCDTPALNFCEEIEACTTLDGITSRIAEYLRVYFHEIIDQLSASPCGYFNTRALATAFCSAITSKSARDFEGKTISIETYDDKDTLLETQTLNLIEVTRVIIEEYRSEENFWIDLGGLILSKFEKFVMEGDWHYGLQAPDGAVLEHPDTWPTPLLERDGVIWRKGCELLEPILWFGLADAPPLPCWILSKKPEMFEDLGYGKGYASIRWKAFWIDSFWTFDWNCLLDHDADVLTTWMFADCGMTEPEKDPIVESCPIVLDGHDDKNALCGKIDAFFMQKFTAEYVMDIPPEV